MLIYGAIASLGFLFLLLMLFVGELFGGDHDVAGHDLAGHDVPSDVDHGPSIFSSRIMASFITAFGVGGVIGRYYNLPHPAASGIGVVSGAVLAGLVYQFAKFLYSQQASSDVHMVGLVGRPAQVTVAIPAGGVGQVTVTTGGERSEHIARAAAGESFRRGSEVVITALGGDGLIVASPGAVRQGGRQ